MPRRTARAFKSPAYGERRGVQKIKERSKDARNQVSNLSVTRVRAASLSLSLSRIQLARDAVSAEEGLSLTHFRFDLMLPARRANGMTADAGIL